MQYQNRDFGIKRIAARKNHSCYGMGIGIMSNSAKNWSACIFLGNYIWLCLFSSGTQGLLRTCIRKKADLRGM